jgi:hypothetical protein
MCRPIERHRYASSRRGGYVAPNALTVGEARVARVSTTLRGTRTGIRRRIAAVRAARRLIRNRTRYALVSLTRHAGKACVLSRNLRAIGVSRAGATGVRCSVAEGSCGCLAIRVGQARYAALRGRVALGLRRVRTVGACEARDAGV